MPRRAGPPQTAFPYQSWVVDNASSDGSLALLEREYPDVRVLRNTENLGFAGGNNTALREVTTPYAVLLNNDATPEPDWLERLLAPFDEPGAERLAAVTSKVVFAPRFLPLQLSTAGVRRPAAPTRATSACASRRVVVDGEDVTARVLWERLTWGPEGEGPAGSGGPGRPASCSCRCPRHGPWEVTVRWAAEAEQGRASWPGTAAASTCPVDRRADRGPSPSRRHAGPSTS